MIDDIALNFNESSIFILNIILAFIMFGIALDLKLERFKKVFQYPKPFIVGLVAQWLLLPFLTFIIIKLSNPMPSLALGMIMVASCPGGNISNFISHFSKADVELSIVLTCVSSIGAVVLTPIIFNFYGNLYEPTQEILIGIKLEWFEVAKTIALIIIVPIILGKFVSYKYETLALKMKRPLSIISMLLFLVIVIGALATNGNYFIEYINTVFGLVLIHNGLAISMAFGFGLLFKLKQKQLRSVTIETGIQNSGLGLLLIFTFFSGLGGMAIIVAWWGVWHIISGFFLAFIWRKYDESFKLTQRSLA